MLSLVQKTVLKIGNLIILEQLPRLGVMTHGLEKIILLLHHTGKYSMLMIDHKPTERIKQR